MLKIESLCVGNYLYRDGVVVKIDARSIFDMWNNENLSKIGYSPIPISIEWLKFFNFTSDYILEEEDNTYIKFKKEEGGFNFKIVYNTKENYFILDFITGSLFEYKYVHQLQNLFYLHTGENIEKLNYKMEFKDSDTGEIIQFERNRKVRENDKWFI